MTSNQQWLAGFAKYRVQAADPFDVDLDGITNCGLTAAVGITVSGLNPLSVYTVSIDTPNTAWSANSNTNQWSTEYRVTTSGGEDTKGGASIQSSAALAYAAFPIGETITGFSSYTFWLRDPLPADNTGVLHLRFTPA